MDFGVIVPQGWRMDLVGISDPSEAYETMTRVAQEADALGYHSIWLYDHFHTVPTPTQEVTFECWTSTAALARDTKRVRIGQLVTCNSYRNPALLAKMASTVDVLSDGQLAVGVGAGWHEHEYRAYGYDYPDGPERLRQLREALQVIRAMWEQEEATFEGRYYQVRGAINQPKGVQKPHIPILIGGGGEKVTLKPVAQYGDACNVSGDLKTLEHKLAVLRQHCESVGRDYESIYRTTSAFCSIADSDDEALALVPEVFKPEIRDTSLVGSPATIRQRIAALEALRVQVIIMDLPSATDLTVLYRFSQEFIV